MKQSFLLLILLIFMLLHPAITVTGASNGLLLWYSSVVPALFPFMVLSSLIVSSGSLSVLMAPARLVLGPLLGLSAEGCYTLLSGLVCGFPMGAKTCADFLSRGQLSLKEGKFLMAVCNHASPMFLLGYVYPLFHGNLPLWKLLAAVYGPALLLALPARLLYRNGALAGRKPKIQGIAEPQKIREPQKIPESRKISEPRKIPESNFPSPAKSNPGNLSADEAILSSVEVLCRIGGLLILFSIAVEFLRGARQLPAGLRLFLMGAMEMTTGIRVLAKALPYPYSAAAVCTSLTFGGLSGIFQTKAALGALAQKKKAGLSIRQYCVWKLLYACLTAAILLALEA